MKPEKGWSWSDCRFREGVEIRINCNWFTKVKIFTAFRWAGCEKTDLLRFPVFSHHRQPLLPRRGICTRFCQKQWNWCFLLSVSRPLSHLSSPHHRHKTWGCCNLSLGYSQKPVFVRCHHLWPGHTGFGYFEKLSTVASAQCRGYPSGCVSFRVRLGSLEKTRCQSFYKCWRDLDVDLDWTVTTSNCKSSIDSLCCRQSSSRPGRIWKH